MESGIWGSFGLNFFFFLNFSQEEKTNKNWENDFSKARNFSESGLQKQEALYL